MVFLKNCKCCGNCLIGGGAINIHLLPTTTLLSQPQHQLKQVKRLDSLNEDIGVQYLDWGPREEESLTVALLLSAELSRIEMEIILG